MSTFASTTKEALAWRISEEASKIARKNQFKKGKIAVCFRAATDSARDWIHEDDDVRDYASVHNIHTRSDDEKDSESCEDKGPKTFDELESLSSDELSNTIDDAIKRRKIKLYDDQFINRYHFGSSFCYPIYDHQNKVQFYLVVIVNSNCTPTERDIIYGLRDVIEKWCKENNFWTSKSCPRPAGMIAC
ncbi:hypothetical protein IK110_03340 [Candidatus Saccharibacteria bacterium]|nr:hypothetical protein [Candidatus Saccharibacteria bacterium]